MGKLEDPNFRYHTKAESEQPGYLEKRMELYKKMVLHEQGGEIYSEQKDRSFQQRHHGAFSGEQVNGKPDSPLFVVGGKG